MFDWRSISRAATVVVALAAAAPASAETVRFYLEETDASSFDISGYFDVFRTGSSISVTDFAVSTGAGTLTEGRFETDGYTYTDENGSVASFLAGPLYFQNNTEYFTVDDFTTRNPARLILWGQSTSVFNSYINTVLSGGFISTVIGLTECFNCSPYRTGGFATLTNIAPILDRPDIGIGGEIPLPASAWLLLGGLGLLAAAPKRKS